MASLILSLTQFIFLWAKLVIELFYMFTFISNKITTSKMSIFNKAFSNGS